MAKYLGYGTLLLAATLGTVMACGGGGGSGSDNTGDKPGTMNGGNGSGLGWPSALPASTAECANASGSDGCYAAACCAELVKCAKNKACATTYDCYVTCPSSDADCFLKCAGSSFEAGGDDFGAAMGCLAPLALSCGAPGGGEGGSGSGSGSDGGSGPGAPVGPLGSAKDSLGWDLNVAAEPLVAELEPDTDRAVSEEVTLAGGTITATAADGTTFELVIPEGTFYGPTLITLTPLASLAVPPLEGPAYGVQIEPDGLPLMRAPTLSITPAKGKAWPIAQQVPLSITGSDNAVALASLEPSSETLQLVLTHFSSYGVLLSQKGLGATLAAGEVRSRFGGDVVDRLQSAAAERLGKERINVFLGGEADDANLASIADLFSEYEEHVVKVRVAKAGESCAAGKLAFQTAVGFERLMTLLSVEESHFPLGQLLGVVTEVCLREEYELCRDHHIITRVIPALLSVWRQAQLLGDVTEIDGVSIPPAYVFKAEQYVKSCLKFELQFDSDVLYSDGADEETSMNETVTARVPFEYTASIFTIPAETLPPHAARTDALIQGGPGELESKSYGVRTDQLCRSIDTKQPVAGDLYVSASGFVPADTTEETPGGNPELLDFGLSLALSPNLSTYQFTDREESDGKCGQVVANGEEFLSWSTTLGSYLLEQHTTGESGPLFDKWDIQKDGGQILAVKDISMSGMDGSATYRGPVNMVIIHTPDP